MDGWKSVVNQARVVDALRNAVSADRIAHAYLFYGPSGVGKRAVALAFAQALLCERGGADPCGECRGCHKVAKGIHPDLRVHMPFAGSDIPSELGRRRELLAEDPYTRVDFSTRPSLDDPTASSNKQTRYAVEYVHEELIRAQAYRPVEGRHRVTVVTEAHLLGERGSNALLKSLEEPPRQTVNILLTDRPDLLLPTIISRCEQVRFAQLGADDIERALLGHSIDPAYAGVVARMADGSLTRALDLAADPDLAARRELVVAFMRAAYTGRPERLNELVTTIVSDGREQLKGTFLALLDWVRDLLLFGETADPNRIVNVDQSDAIAAFCRSLPEADIAAMVGLVEEAIGLAERNANAKLLVTVLATKLGRAMHGRPVGPLFEPLVAVTSS